MLFRSPGRRFLREREAGLQGPTPIHVDLDTGAIVNTPAGGHLTAVRVYQYGMLETLKRLWPNTWNAFTQDNPCVLSD